MIIVIIMIITIMAVMIMMVISNVDADDDFDDVRAHIGRDNPNKAKTRNRSRNIPSERALYLFMFPTHNSQKVKSVHFSKLL